MLELPGKSGVRIVINTEAVTYTILDDRPGENEELVIVLSSGNRLIVRAGDGVTFEEIKAVHKRIEDEINKRSK